MQNKLVPRTIRVQEVYWEAILTHFRNSPDGTTGSDIIRRAVKLLGEWCMAREAAAKPPTSETPDELLRVLYNELEKKL